MITFFVGLFCGAVIVAFLAAALLKGVRQGVGQALGTHHWTYKECVEAGHTMTGSGDGSSVWCWDKAHGDKRPKMYVER